MRENKAADGDAGAGAPSPQPEPAVEGPVSARFELEFLGGMRLDRDPAWLIPGLVPRRGLLVLYGTAGSGKSFLALDLALHVAAGRPWAGRSVRQAGVIYVASEAGRGMRRRVIAAMSHHGFDPTIPFALVTRRPDLGQRDGDAGVLVADIRRQIPADFKVGLVVLDTLARSMAGGDESGTGGMGIFIEQAEAIAEAFDALVLPVHHMGKDVSRGMRGSSALLGAADAVWQVPPEGRSRILVEKLKEDVDGVEVQFSLERFDLGTDGADEPITTCVVSVGTVVSPGEGSGAPHRQAPAEDEAESPPEQNGLTRGTRVFLDSLVEVIARHGELRKRSRTIPAGTKAIRQAELGGFAEIVIASTSAKSRRTQIDRFVGDLVKRGVVGRHDGYLWVP